jgi:hypothetical protein
MGRISYVTDRAPQARDGNFDVSDGDSLRGNCIGTMHSRISLTCSLDSGVWQSVAPGHDGYTYTSFDGHCHQQSFVGGESQRAGQRRPNDQQRCSYWWRRGCQCALPVQASGRHPRRPAGAAQRRARGSEALRRMHQSSFSIRAGELAALPCVYAPSTHISDLPFYCCEMCSLLRCCGANASWQLYRS